MLVVRFAVRLRVVVTVVAVRGRSPVVRVPVVPVVVVVRVPDRIEDQRRDIHAGIHVHRGGRLLWRGLRFGCGRGGLRV